jgi:hypothetical protein
MDVLGALLTLAGFSIVRGWALHDDKLTGYCFLIFVVCLVFVS